MEMMAKHDHTEMKPLSANEKMKLAELERRIVIDFGAFYRVGTALAEINERRLYRESHNTFDAYCKDMWDMCKSRAYQLIDAAEVCENLKMSLSTNCGQTDDVIEMLPLNEAQARELAKLAPEQQPLAWEAVINFNPEKKPTARLVKKAVKEIIGEKVTRTIRNTQTKISALDIVGANFKEAFNAFLDQVKEARDGGYKVTSRRAILKHLDAVRTVIAEDGVVIDDGILYGSDDAKKVERAGFTLYRMDRTSMTIKVRAGGGWPKHSGPYDTIKELEAEFALLMQNDKTLRG
jgi:hypothetical protein